MFFSIQIYIEDVEVTVEGDFEPYIPAKLSGHPDDWYPAEGGVVYVESVRVNEDDLDPEEDVISDKLGRISITRDENGKITDCSVDLNEDALYEEVERTHNDGMYD